MLLWYPKAVIDTGKDAGPFTDPGEPKGLFHTTEGKNYAGAKSAYVAKNVHPHFTCSYEKGFFQCWQHIAINLAARALQNKSGGTETNTDNVIQIELVGTSDIRNRESWGKQYVEDFPTGYLDGIKELMRWIETQTKIPRRSDVVWKSYPSSSGLDNGVRLTNTQWDNYSGWLGHQHAAENEHGDPGLINIIYLLEDEDEMTEDDFKRIQKMITDAKDETIKQVNGTKPLIVARAEAVPGGPDPWYSIPAQTRSEETRDTATQAVSQGTARWWDATNPGPVRIPSSVIDSLALLEDIPE